MAVDRRNRTTLARVRFMVAKIHLPSKVSVTGDKAPGRRNGHALARRLRLDSARGLRTAPDVRQALEAVGPVLRNLLPLSALLTRSRKHPCQGLVDRTGDFVDVVGGGDQRGREAERVVQPRKRAVGDADHHALRHAVGDHGLGLFLVHRFLGVTVRDQFGTAEQPKPAHIADHAVLFLQGQKVVDQLRAPRGGVLQKAFFFDDGHVFQRRRRAGGAAAEGGDVAEIVQGIVCVVLEHRKDLFGRHHAGDGGIARGHALGHGHEVGLDAVVLIAEPGAGAPDAADHLVDVQEDVVFLADLADALPIAFGGRDDAAACGDGFKAEPAHGVGAFAQDDFLDLVRGPFAVVLGFDLGAVFQAMGHFDEAGRIGAVLGVAFGLAARGEAGDGGAVIITLAEEDLVLFARRISCGRSGGSS